jgi:hypothetical protein
MIGLLAFLPLLAITGAFYYVMSIIIEEAEDTID